LVVRAGCEYAASFSDLSGAPARKRRLTIDALPGDPLFHSPTARRWNAWKERKAANWNIDHICARLRANSSLGEDIGFGGALRLSGLRELTGRV